MSFLAFAIIFWTFCLWTIAGMIIHMSVNQDGFSGKQLGFMLFVGGPYVWWLTAWPSIARGIVKLWMPFWNSLK